MEGGGGEGVELKMMVRQILKIASRQGQGQGQGRQPPGRRCKWLQDIKADMVGWERGPQARGGMQGRGAGGQRTAVGLEATADLSLELGKYLWFPKGYF